MLWVNHVQKLRILASMTTQQKKRWNTKFSTINFVVVCHDDIALWAFSINHPHIFEFPTAFGSNKQYAS